MKMRVAIITVSDRGSAGERDDLSGPALCHLVEKSGYKVVRYTVVPDEMCEVVALFKSITDSHKADLILTTGGTGFAVRDITPEATREVIEKEVPGLPELIRSESAKVTNRAWLSRGTAGIRAKTLIINLPGSPKAAKESFKILSPVLGHGMEILTGMATDCASAE